MNQPTSRVSRPSEIEVSQPVSSGAVSTDVVSTDVDAAQAPGVRVTDAYDDAGHLDRRSADVDDRRHRATRGRDRAARAKTSARTSGRTADRRGATDERRSGGDRRRKPEPGRRRGAHRRIAPSGSGAGGGFRRDVEGLRGVAVALVVAFHAGVPWLTGGYVGVDVFFVLSGFLITGLLVDELRRSGTVSLRGFYARRIRRLLPHATLVLVATTVAALFLLPPLDRADVGRDASAAGLFVANWHFAAEATDYLTAGDRSPVLHYWSLSVEEQFYLFWPLLLLVVTRGGIALRRWDVTVRRLALTVGAVALTSFAVSALLTEASGPYGYFGVHTRAWELAAGAAIALARPVLGRMPRWTAVFAGWAGLVLILYSAVRYGESTVFPGVAAIAPVSGTALLLLAGARVPGAGASLAVSVKPLSWLGRHSYGFYLWHWPCLVFLWAYYGAPGDASELDGSPGAPWYAVAAVVLLALLLAVVTARLLEQPIRRSRRLAAAHWRSLALGVALTAVAASLPGAALSAAEAPALPTALRVAGAVVGPGSVEEARRPDVRSREAVPVSLQAAAAAREDLPDAGPCTAGLKGERVTTADDCFFGDTDARRTIALIGDSHARSWFPAFDAYAKEANLRLFFASKDSCPIADVRSVTPAGFDYDACPTWRADVLARLGQIDGLQTVYLVRFAAYAKWLVDADGGRYAPDAAGPVWRAGLDRTLDVLGEVAPKVVLMRDIPWPGKDVPACLSTYRSDARSCSFALEGSVRDGILAEADRELADDRPGVVTLDVNDVICAASPCQVVTPGGEILFRDSHHLTAAFSATLGPKVGPLLAAAARSKG